MCGIAGYSAASSSELDRTLTAQALLAAIAERGADAVGFAHRARTGAVTVCKQRGGAGGLLEAVAIPEDSTEVLLHVRDYTKGHPEIDANNHPVRHGALVGIHNGAIQNDDAVLAEHGWARQEPGMTVDTEVILAVAEAGRSRARDLEQLRGTMAAAWIDEREDSLLYLARGTGRPLWLGTAKGLTLFASTVDALEIAERYAGLRLAKREVEDGTLLVLAEGRVVRRERFRPDGGEAEPQLPAVRAPAEGTLAMQRLAAMYTAG